MNNFLSTSSVTNPLKVDFTCYWGKQPIVIPALTTVSLPTEYALHAAKHLAQKILLEGGRYEDYFLNGKVHSRAVGRKFRFQLAESLINQHLNVDVKDVIRTADELIKTEDNTTKAALKREANRKAVSEGKVATDFGAEEAIAELEAAEAEAGTKTVVEPTRKELEAEALGLGIDAQLVRNAKNKAEVQGLIAAVRESEQVEVTEEEAGLGDPLI